MGKVYTLNSTECITSDDVTAKKSNVLAGTKTITSDSDNVIVNGTMPDNTTRTSNGSVPGINNAYPDIPTREGDGLQIGNDTSGTLRINIMPPRGYYPGGGGSYVNRPTSDFGDASADKVLADSTFTSTAGIKRAGTMANVASLDLAKSIASDSKSAYFRMTNGAHINNASSGYPEVYTALSNFGDAAASDVSASKTFTSSAGLKKTGTLAERGQSQSGNPVWCNTYLAINKLPEGIYRKNGADWAPEARCTADQLRSALGITADKIVSGQSIAGVSGNKHPYGYIVGDVTSDTSAAFYDSSNFYMCRFNLPFEPMVGYVIHYHSSNRLRDITVFAPDNRGAKFARMMNFNQARMGGNYSYGFAQGEHGAQCGKGDCIIPVAYGNSSYQYFFAGYY